MFMDTPVFGQGYLPSTKLRNSEKYYTTGNSPAKLGLVSWLIYFKGLFNFP